MRKLLGCIGWVSDWAWPVVGWYVWPVTYTESAPTRLRQDWKDEAIWMAAQAYAYDRDLEAAQARLRPLGSDDLGGLVFDRAERRHRSKLASAARSPIWPGWPPRSARDRSALDPYLTP